MRFSWLRKTIAWYVFFTICALIMLPMFLLPIGWLGLAVIYPAYWVSIKYALLPSKYRKAPHSFWMPATFNLITMWLCANIFAPALYRLFAPIFLLVPEFAAEFVFWVWPVMFSIPASYICYMLTVPEVPEWHADDVAIEQNATDTEDAKQLGPGSNSFLNKYTANDENAG